ncbi:MAG TPA: hypothetical protein PLS10_09870 [Chitinophagales bacterium]|nr:hypothetical protein [Chitinophagales bacterium]
MKKIYSFLLLLFVVLFLAAKNNIAGEAEKLKQTELAFSKLCGEKGMKISFLAYADKNVIKAEGDNQFPVIGIDSLAASFSDERENFKLEWYPTKVEVSKSKDLGFTFGNWILTKTNGDKKYGIYYTVWKKQKDNTWKFIFDGGNSTPGLLKD